MAEAEGHEAVAVFVHLVPCQPPVADVPLAQDVLRLGHLGMELRPLLRVVLHELAALRLLRDDKVGAYFGELPSLEVAEVAPRQELRILRHVVVVGLSAEDVLLLQGVALAECLYEVGEHVLEAQVLLRVRA